MEYWWFDGVSYNAGGSDSGTNTDYYEWGALTNFTGITNTAPLVHGGETNLAGIICAMGGQQQDIRVIKVSSGNTLELLGTIAQSEIPSSSSVITMSRMNGIIAVHVNNGSTDEVKFTVPSNKFDDSSTNMAALWAFGRNSTSGNARQYMNAGYRSGMSAIQGRDTTIANATGNFTCPAITAGSSTSKMGAVITYQDNAGTNALNTDIVLQLSADNGSNFSTATLTALPDFSSGIKMAKVNDLSVTAGTQLKYKISFANQSSGVKEARIRGVSLNY